MLQLERLYSEPAAFDEIRFTSGLNVILGESDDSSEKNNGVGKSLSVEFINFALLKTKGRSRIARIPKDVLPDETMICLDLVIGTSRYTIRRSVGESETPSVEVDGETIAFAKIADASKYLTEKLFHAADIQHPEIRGMMGPLMRDEGSEFKSIISCFDTATRAPDDYEPHLYLLGIDIEPYRQMRAYFKELEDAGTESKRIKEGVELLTKHSIKDAKAEINNLSAEVKKINTSIETLENTAGYDAIKNDIIALEGEIEDLRRERSILKRTVAKLNPINREVILDSGEIGMFYDSLKAGLGHLVARELDEVQMFKSKIEEFQRHLLNERSVALRKEIDGLDRRIDALDQRYRGYLEVLDTEGNLKNLRQTYAAAQKKSDELGRLKSFLTRYDEIELRKQQIRSEKEAKLLELQTSISGASEAISSLETMILDMHEFIQGNRKASFEVRTTSKKQVVDIEFRMDDDGSHSVDREKVFIYDFSLLTDGETKVRHPGFLVHDNIFEVDDHTLSRSLEYILTKAELSDRQQYVLTLNAERLQGVASSGIVAQVEKCVVARFTKSERFLRQKYQERL